MSVLTKTEVPDCGCACRGQSRGPSGDFLPSSRHTSLGIAHSVQTDHQAYRGQCWLLQCEGQQILPWTDIFLTNVQLGRICIFSYFSAGLYFWTVFSCGEKPQHAVGEALKSLKLLVLLDTLCPTTWLRLNVSVLEKAKSFSPAKLTTQHKQRRFLGTDRFISRKHNCRLLSLFQLFPISSLSSPQCGWHRNPSRAFYQAFQSGGRLRDSKANSDRYSTILDWTGQACKSVTMCVQCSVAMSFAFSTCMDWVWKPGLAASAGLAERPQQHLCLLLFSL